jgi:hypothetical protein
MSPASAGPTVGVWPLSPATAAESRVVSYSNSPGTEDMFSFHAAVKRFRRTPCLCKSGCQNWAQWTNGTRTSRSKTPPPEPPPRRTSSPRHRKPGKQLDGDYVTTTLDDDLLTNRTQSAGPGTSITPAVDAEQTLDGDGARKSDAAQALPTSNRPTARSGYVTPICRRRGLRRAEARPRFVFGRAPPPTRFTDTADLERTRATVATGLGAEVEAWHGESGQVYRARSPRCRRIAVR